MKIDYHEFARRYTNNPSTKNKPIEMEETIAVFVINFTLSAMTTFCFYMGGANSWICAGVFFGMYIIQNRISAIRK